MDLIVIDFRDVMWTIISIGHHNVEWINEVIMDLKHFSYIIPRNLL